MVKRLIVPLVCLALWPAAVNARTNESAAGDPAKRELLQGSSQDKIILPEVDLTIEDESEVPLRGQGDRPLRDTLPDFGDIDMDELSRAKVADRFKSDMREDRRRDDFTLSAFKFQYGRYENFLADISVGKRVGGLNYLLTYYRNNRASVGSGTNTYYNTELEKDDLRADLIWSVSSNWDLSAQFGYLNGSTGLFTNDFFVSESKTGIPVRMGALYLVAPNSVIRANASYNSLALTHKNASGYGTKYVWEAGADVSFEANWSRDNFLKALVSYQYASLDGSPDHFGRIAFTDKFPVISSLALQAGAEVDFYSRKSVYWYPILLGFYRFSDMLSVKAGLTGSQENQGVDRYLREDQIDYQPTPPEERWTFLATATLAPVRTLKLKGGVSYHSYANYVQQVFQASNALYTLSAVSNLGVLETDAGLELIAFENLVVGAGYRFRIPFAADLLFFAVNQAYLEAELSVPDWGTRFSTRLGYRDRVRYADSPAAWLPPALVWDFTAMQSLTKDLSVEVKLNNILNQETYERPCVPGGGFAFSAGLRILL